MLASSQSLNTLAPRLFDNVRNVGRFFVLPSADDQPSRLPETLIVPAIPGDVSIKFGAPPVGICLWCHGVFWTIVPEAAIDEDRDPGSSKRDVGAAGKGCDVYPVANPSTMQFTSECEFRPGPCRREVRHKQTDIRT